MPVRYRVFRNYACLSDFEEPVSSLILTHEVVKEEVLELSRQDFENIVQEDAIHLKGDVIILDIYESEQVRKEVQITPQGIQVSDLVWNEARSTRYPENSRPGDVEDVRRALTDLVERLVSSIEAGST